MKLKLTYTFMIIMAVVFGKTLGDACAAMSEPGIIWLGKYLNFGFDTVNFSFSAISLSFGLNISINPIQVLLIILAVAISPKISELIK